MSTACRRELTDVRGVRGLLDAREVEVLARLDELTVDAPAIFPEDELAKAAKSSLTKAVKVRHRKDTCERVPELGAALADGATTGDRVDVLANATVGLKPDELARVAEHGCGDRRHGRQRDTTAIPRNGRAHRRASS